MIRRDLLKMLTAAPLLSQVTAPRWAIPPYAEKYRGFELYWHGWIKLYNQHAQVGSWMARNPSKNRRHVYSAYPGATMSECEGDMMDIAVRDDQVIPMPWATEAELESYKQNAYSRLIVYIEQHYHELVT